MSSHSYEHDHKMPNPLYTSAKDAANFLLPWAQQKFPLAHSTYQRSTQVPYELKRLAKAGSNDLLMPSSAR
jgi:hypothetical protein